MTDFDPAKFEDKFENYFAEIHQAYTNAFETMNNRYDSELIHAIDQFVLSESEPVYKGNTEQAAMDDSTDSMNDTTDNEDKHDGDGNEDGPFRIELPADPDPYDRLQGVVVDEGKFEEILEQYLTEIEAELQAIFDLPE